MIKKIDFKNARVIVELGPGNGAITKHILKKIAPESTLICFEINANFYNQLIALNHPQLIVVKASAENIKEELQNYNFTKVDYIISSLPLTIIPEEVSDSILETSLEVLLDNGFFIQYQYSLTYFKKLKSVFKDSIKLDFEFLNFPPAFIYRCKK